MKAAVLAGLRQIEITNVPEPVINSDTDVLLKIEMAGVCGSDVHYYETGHIGSQVIEYPFIVGHECAATVEQVGKSVNRVKVGRRIAVEAAISCHECDQCKAGRENTCRNLKFLGCPGQIAGCLCEYIVMPQECCYPINDSMSFEKAVLCEPLAIGVYAVQQADIAKQSDIAILGAGPIGLSCILAAKAQGVNRFYVTEKIPERIETARTTGAEWVGNPKTENIIEQILKRQPEGLDVVFECAGQQETIDEAVEILRPGGKLMLIGIPGEDRVSFIIDKIRRKEITLINVRRQNKCTGKCVELVQSNQINPDFMVTHRFTLDQTQDAFELVAGYRDGVVKAMIEFANNT